MRLPKMNLNEETLIFYHQLGRSIIAWSNVEIALGNIVTLAHDRNNRVLAARGFTSIDNFRTKLQYANTIVRSLSVGKAELANWALMFDRAQRLSKKRNKLAHYWVLTSPNIKTPGRRVMLMPFKYVESDRRQRYAGAVRLLDIKGYQQEFVSLALDLENFQCRISGQKERFPRPLKPEHNPPTIPRIRRETLAYVQHLLEPSRE